MNFIDYREKLGIGFNDEEKFKYLKTIIFNVITPDSGYDTYFFMSAREYFDFCNLTGSELHSNLLGGSYRSHSTERFSDCVNILKITLMFFLTSYYTMFHWQTVFLPKTEIDATEFL